MGGQSGGNRNIIDELQSWDIQGDQMEAYNMVVLEVSTMNLILGMWKEMKWKVKVVLLEVSLIDFILQRSNKIK